MYTHPARSSQLINHTNCRSRLVPAPFSSVVLDECVRAVSVAHEPPFQHLIFLESLSTLQEYCSRRQGMKMESRIVSVDVGREKERQIIYTWLFLVLYPCHLQQCTSRHGENCLSEKDGQRTSRLHNAHWPSLAISTILRTEKYRLIVSLPMVTTPIENYFGVKYMILYYLSA